MRTETDFLGAVELPDEYPFGIHTFRAAGNFAFSAERIRPDLFAALIVVKKVAALANREAGLLDDRIATAIVSACDEVLKDVMCFLPPLHPLQGGAGTSTNMAANELVANLALRQLGLPFGRYEAISPLDHVNLSQSTNDTVPTALRIAVVGGLHRLHDASECLLDALQGKEHEFSRLLKVGRTELQDAMPLSLGQEFSAWAEGVSRFRWRLDKAVDWVREVNLSGTAIGTGINADRGYARAVIDLLRRETQEPLALARNLIDATANLDPLVEVSGLIRTGAVTVKKIAADLRLLSSGPRCGFGEIRLPAQQEGSSIMPGKVNPVMPEAVEQVCLAVIGGDTVIAIAAAESDLQLPQFFPLVAHTLLTNLELLAGALRGLGRTVSGITADEARLSALLDQSFAAATLLAPVIGHERVAELVSEAKQTGEGVLALIRRRGILDEARLARLLTPEIMAAPGMPLLEDDDGK